MDETAKAPLAADPSAREIHVYDMSTGNKAVGLICAILLFCLAGWFCIMLSVPHLRARRAPDAHSITICVAVASFFSGLGVLTIRSLRTRVILTSSQVVITGLLTYTVPFSEIRGLRAGGGRSVNGIYLYRRGKSRVFVRESLLQLDNFYNRWRASVYDLDKADRLKRKAAAKPRMLDCFAVDDNEQHPAIGGPDSTTS